MRNMRVIILHRDKITHSSRNTKKRSYCTPIEMTQRRFREYKHTLKGIKKSESQERPDSRIPNAFKCIMTSWLGAYTSHVRYHTVCGSVLSNLPSPLYRLSRAYLEILRCNAIQ